MRTLSVRQPRARQRQGLQLLARADSIQDLPEPDGRLEPGSPMVVEFQLNAPVGPAFNVAGAELAFQPFAPDGLELIDVRGDGLWKAVVEFRVLPNAEATQAILRQPHASMALPVALPFIPTIIAFIKAHWIGLAIGGFVLGSIISGVTVLGVFAHGAGSGLGMALPILLIGGAAVLWFSGRQQRRGST